MSKLYSKVKALMLYWLSLVLIFFPSTIKVPIYRRVFGYKIGVHVKIGMSWISVGWLEIGDCVTIGHFNRFKNIPEVRIGDYTTIGTGNTFTSTFEFISAEGVALRGNRPMLIIGNHCGITIGHYFDVQDSFTSGSFTVIAGINSVFLTHYIDVINNTQSAKPINIGKYCMIGSNARFVPGAGIAHFCVVGMGSVVTKSFSEMYTSYGGNPVAAIRKLPEDAAYFHRTVGWIGKFAPPPFDNIERLEDL